MSTVSPRSKVLTRAVQWISDSRKERPDARLHELVSEASQRFDLSPLDSDALFETILAEEKALKKGSE